MKNIIQIAGIQNLTEAQMLAYAGTTHIGVPLRLDVHDEDISEKQAARIIPQLPPAVTPVLITYLHQADAIIELARKIGVNWVQLHGDISTEEMGNIKCFDPTITIIKSLIVRQNNHKELLTAVDQLNSTVDYFITDTYDPETGATGATGKTHDWSISQKIVEFSQKPVILAGGLNPNNVQKAIQVVRPNGVDCHSGVEKKQGFKDPQLVKKFIEMAQLGFSKI